MTDFKPVHNSYKNLQTVNGIGKILAFTILNFAIRHNDIIKRYYQRKASKTNHIIAIKTVAHKIARACFYILRDGVQFDVKMAFMK